MAECNGCPEPVLSNEERKLLPVYYQSTKKCGECDVTYWPTPTYELDANGNRVAVAETDEVVCWECFHDIYV